MAVTTSTYATIFGVPVALLGALYYGMLLLLLMAYRETSRRVFLVLCMGATSVGLGMTLWFVYLQLFVLRALCQWCMVSALTTTLLFILMISMLRYTHTYGFHDPNQLEGQQ